MPQERSDARKLERELKIKFEWREADKNLEKEERNKPVDFSSAPMDALLQMETRSWKTGDVSAQNQTASVDHPYRAAGSGFRSRSGKGGGGFGGGRPGGQSRPGGRSSSRPGTSRSGPARRGQ